MNIEIAYVCLAGTTWFMTGLIWFVQIVHYPLFSAVGAEKFTEYARVHCNSTGLVVGFPMLAQALLSLWLASYTYDVGTRLLWLNFFSVLLIWLLTAIFSVPCHQKLCAEGFSASVHRLLVLSNWLRTVLWSLCSLIMAYMLATHLKV